MIDTGFYTVGELTEIFERREQERRAKQRNTRERRREEMATPSKKSKHLTEFLDTLSGRTSAIEDDYCVRVPIGCGAKAGEFRDALSAKEYTISGLCQRCQDAVFGV